MSSPIPAPLDYESAQDRKQRRPRRRLGTQMFFGLVIGAVLSGIVWGSLFGPGYIGWLHTALVALLCIIIGGSLLLAASPHTRYFGIGLIISIALGGLIFCICTATFWI